MVTIFTTAKPFLGHSGVIQRNALKSWKLLHADVEVILFGDDEGAGAAANDLSIRYEPEIRRAEHGTKYLNYLFEQAQKIAKHDLLCYVNCDIILTDGFLRTVERLATLHKYFLMVGQRCDINIEAPLDFTQNDWDVKLLTFARATGQQRPPWFIDYFVFTRGLYRDLPPLVIGRVGWDNWLVWKARSLQIPVIDVTPVFSALHQIHDYSYHPEGISGVWRDHLSERNRRLAGGRSHLFNIFDATHQLRASGRLTRTNPFRPKILFAKELVFRYAVLKTLGLRKRLGLQRKGWLGRLF